jgi:hypothetical protein
VANLFFPYAIILVNTGKNKKFIKTPGQVIVRIGPPITGENAKKMTDTAYLWIKNSYKEIY